MKIRAYAAHEGLVAPARRYPELWRLVLGLVLVAAVAIFFNSILQSALATAWPEFRPGGLPAGSRPGPMLALLGGFAFLTLGTFLAARVLQHRDPLGIIGPLPQAVRQFWRVLRLLGLLGVVVLVLPPHDFGEPLRPNLPLSRWLMLLPLSLLAVFIQTSAEEILFRGYLQQGLAARFKSPLAWALIPSLLFASGHYTPAEAGDNALLVVLWAGVFGVLMADLTARAGTLGPAIAVHLFNNVVALLIFATPGSLDGLALYHLPFDMADTERLRPWLAVDFAMMVLTWLAARVAIGR